MHHHIRSQLKRPLEIGRHERVVHDHQNTMRMRHLSRTSDVSNLKQRISGGFKQQCRMRPRSRESGVKRVHIVGIDGRIRKAIALEETVENAIGAAINIL